MLTESSSPSLDDQGKACCALTEGHLILWTRVSLLSQMTSLEEHVQHVASSSTSSLNNHFPVNMIPKSMINLRLILVSGKTKDFLFDPNDSAADIAQYVFDHWPQEWSDEAVPRAEILRLIYQGRFLHGNVTLSALSLPLGRTCVMHLVQRENLPDSGNSQDPRLKSKERSTGCCSSSCSLL